MCMNFIFKMNDSLTTVTQRACGEAVSPEPAGGGRLSAPLEVTERRSAVAGRVTRSRPAPLRLLISQAGNPAANASNAVDESLLNAIRDIVQSVIHEENNALRRR
ncbi:hypothetical protein AAFF_G00118740 [Aldrovandia affinis]|uniref:Uncharacterized protein n=1 Tax=Aldrovandia affinis TaxID=143900 RepID=A0AAD7WA80_9TELE|nr:hypothetical protein AAFF_G00118740 [Aldrovandia affinis]